MSEKNISTEQWKELYEFGKKFRKQQPWKFMMNEDILCIRFNEEKQAYFSIMGNREMEYGIMMTMGANAEYEMKKLMYCSRNVSANAVFMAELNCSNMFITSKEMVPDEQLALMKELGISFRGSNWIYFESYEGGYAPAPFSAEEVESFLEYFPVLFKAIKAFQKVNSQEMLTEQVFVYENQQDKWVSHFEDFVIEDFSWKKQLYQNEIQIARLAKKRAKSYSWEFGMCCPGMIVEDEKFKKPSFTKISVASNDGTMICQHIWEPEEDPQCVLDEFAEYILENGKPRQIIVGSEYSHAFLEDFCSKAKIKLIIGEVPSVNEYFGDMAAHFAEEDAYLSPQEVQEIEMLLSEAGIDVEELKENVNNMSYQEFETSFLPEILGSLEKLFMENDFEDDYEE